MEDEEAEEESEEEELEVSKDGIREGDGNNISITFMDGDATEKYATIPEAIEAAEGYAANGRTPTIMLPFAQAG